MRKEDGRKPRSRKRATDGMEGSSEEVASEQKEVTTGCEEMKFDAQELEFSKRQI